MIRLFTRRNIDFFGAAVIKTELFCKDFSLLNLFEIHDYCKKIMVGGYGYTTHS